MIFNTPEQALEFIKENQNTGIETDINGDIFFGITTYVWTDVAIAAGIKKPEHKVTGTKAENSAFHHFRDDQEILTCLRHLQKEYGFLVHRDADSLNAEN